MNLQGFDARQHSGTIGFVPVPEGVYTVMLTKAEQEANSKGDGTIISFAATVQGGNLNGRDILFNINWENPNATAVKIGKDTLSALCNALGIITPNHLNELLSKPFTMEVGVSPDGKYNRLVDVKPIGGAPSYQQPMQTYVAPSMPPPQHMQPMGPQRPIDPACIHAAGTPQEQWFINGAWQPAVFAPTPPPAPYSPPPGPPMPPGPPAGDSPPNWIANQMALRVPPMGNA